MVKKNYQIPAERGEAMHRHAPDHGANFDQTKSSARIDMKALLGGDARFSRGTTTIDLTMWLGCGIDAWVRAVVDVFTILLRSGSHQTSTVTGYSAFMRIFFRFLTEGRPTPRVTRPNDLSPMHVQEFIGWLTKHAQANEWATDSVRKAFCAVKATLKEFFAQGLIPGDPAHYFFRSALPWKFSSKQTALSDTELGRLVLALKNDLTDVHHQRLKLTPRDLQAVRLLVVAIRQGNNPTPLLEMRRDAIAPGILPGTIRIKTKKFRNHKLRSQLGRATSGATYEDIAFSLSEGAVIAMAIEDSMDMALDAPAQYRDRIWLYRSSSKKLLDTVTCLTRETLHLAIKGLVVRHDLRADDGTRLKVNLSRLRKSYFERSFRHADGDLVITANLMGNTPDVAGSNYPVMNAQRQAEAAQFMNVDFAAFMRSASTTNGIGESQSSMKMEIPIKLFETLDGMQPLPTPVASCQNTQMGGYAPRDGHSHCDKYVMCLFCPNFAVVGEVDELWRLFSFQVFAGEELLQLDTALGAERTNDDMLEQLRDRYRLAIPFIDHFTSRQFAASRVRSAKIKTSVGLHPFWEYQLNTSRKARGLAFSNAHVSSSWLDAQIAYSAESSTSST